MRHRRWITTAAFGLFAGLLGLPRVTPAARGAEGGSYYTQTPLFSTHPKEDEPGSIDRFGPVGMGIQLHLPAFRMRIKSIEEGSPAAATGRLRPGQWIESINGRTLRDRDPRKVLGDVLARAEATDGRLVFLVREDEDARPEEVVVTVPVLGAYSETWPLDCPKSDRIVRNMADYLATRTWGGGVNLDGPALLFLLSTGEDRDLEVARRWIQRTVAFHRDRPVTRHGAWMLGYGGIPLAEYYLRTGDETILPVIEDAVRAAEELYMPGGWSTRGHGVWTYYGGGRMSAAGVHVLTFLLLARECGVEVDEEVLQGALRQFFRFAGRGNLAYGDHRPEGGFVDNGKTGALAFAMSAAAGLTPGGEDSVYAAARDISAVKGFYSTSWMLHGHTGGGIGEIWRSASMGLLAEREPLKYREFMDNRAWHYDLSRRFDGSFTILGGERYDNTQWGVGYALTYTIPRRTLRIAGAPPGPFSRTHALPERPWGTEADDAFYSRTPAPDRQGRVHNVGAERLATDAGAAIGRRLSRPDVSDEELLRYARHPDQGIRDMAAGQIGRRRRTALVAELLDDRDARGRFSAVQAIRALPAAEVTGPMQERMIAMLNDPAESWWVVDNVLQTANRIETERLARHTDRLLHWLDHEDWWMSSSALQALVRVATHEEDAVDRVFPRIGAVLAANQRFGRWTPWGLEPLLKDAPPTAQAAARDMLTDAYLAWPEGKERYGDPQHPQAGAWFVDGLARLLAGLPDGMETLYRVGRVRFPDRTLPHQDLFLGADRDRLGPELAEAVDATIRENLIPEFVGRHAADLLRGNRLEELVALYRSIGVHDYDWQRHGPRRNEMEWNYFSFDPVEQPPHGQERARLGRYREVTYPAGMERWYAPDFDPAAAGWRRGFAPFASDEGRLPPHAGLRNCQGEHDFCGCGEPARTLWENEVLLLNGTFDVPPFEEGYAYRILIGGMSHVSAGDGARVYVNGRLIYQRRTAVDRRGGMQPIGTTIDREWWPEFEDGRVQLAATSFLKYHPRTGRYGNYITIFLQRRKMPPLDTEMMLRAARVTPMTSTAWQAMQDPDRGEEASPDEGKFTWDGTRTPNRALRGSWTQLGRVNSLETFIPGQRIPTNARWPLQRIAFEPNGRTDDPLLFYTGDTLMDLGRREALEMTVREIDGETYLFVEAGGFDARHGPDWKPPLYVLRRER